MVTEDGKFDFSDVTLKSIRDKFYFKRKNKYYEVSHDEFKSMLVFVAQQSSKNITPVVDKTNKETLEFLLSQLEVDEVLFTAYLYDSSDWIMN